MNEKIKQWDKLGDKNPFKVPEGYFEGLTAQIMSRLPKKTNEETKVVSLWERTKPWLYMAAMFAGIALMMKIFVPSSPEGLNLTSVTEVEEFYQYYEDQLAGNIYHETIYLDEFE
jgi:hypothetical protein